MLSRAVVKIGLNLKPNHHNQVKLVKIHIMHIPLYPSGKIFFFIWKMLLLSLQRLQKVGEQQTKIFHFYDYFLHFTTSQKKAKKKFANYLTLLSPFVGCENLFFCKEVTFRNYFAIVSKTNCLSEHIWIKH